ncbi:MAG: hypothetical protein H0V65_05495 [Chitinophagales bacterium]|nr:hypothetical protein [Chitinophagales bacterium]
MFFKDVVGQQAIKARLIGSVREQRVSHTQMFLGAEGTGNLSLALAFSQYVNCEKKRDTDSCGICSSCIKAQKLVHPDVHFTFPTIKAKDRNALSSEYMKEWRTAILENPYLNYLDWVTMIADENKQGNISADECREVFSKLSLKVFESEYKVLIVWMPERLGKEGNILLKLFEEPSDKTLIILVAENQNLLLPTIISRTQVLQIPRIDDQSLIETLEKRYELSRQDAEKIMRHSDGNYREALRLINQVEDNNQQVFNQWMQLLYRNNVSDLIKWIEDVARIGRENQKSFLRYGLEFLHECIMMQHIGEHHSRLQTEEKRLATWLSQHMQFEDWQEMMRIFDESHYYIERNAHPKILYMNLSLRLRRMISKKKLSLTV